MAEPVLVTHKEDMAEVALNRPEAFNALNLDMLDGLTQELVALAKDDSVKGVVLYGEGKAFCAGGDLKWALKHPHGPGAAFHALAGRFHSAVLEIRRMHKPVVAAIGGATAGGGFSLALACDFRVMERSSFLKQAYTSSGLSIDGGGTFMLPRLVGLSRALEIAAFDEPIWAEKALEWNLATRVVEDGTSREEALKLLRGLAQGSLHSFGWSKKLLNDAFHTALEAQMEQERMALVVCGEHEHGREGVQAFVEKRKPDFK
jgi:2-(1,2-epoxy-1,2-dihydrophenyl)acetyl-CoA isomerase